MSLKPHILQWSDEDAKEILKTFDRTAEAFTADEDMIIEWVESQPHLPKILDRNRLRRFLVLNKLSMEKTKKKIDAYFTIRSLIPELYQDRQPWQPEMQEFCKNVYWYPLPKRRDDLCRVSVLHLKSTDPEIWDPIKFFAHILNIAEVRMDQDCVLADVYVLDFKGMGAAHLVKLSPMMLKKINTITEKVFSDRVKEFHIVNINSKIETFANVIKSMMRPKIAARFHTHTSYEGLYNFVPKDILPVEFGGTGPELAEVHENWTKEWENYRDWFNKLQSAKVDESLRPGEAINDEYLGFHGTFRKLDLD